MKNLISFAILFLLAVTSVVAQVGINSDNSSPNSSAMLDVKSTTKGLLPPRMTFEERNAIVNPAEGLSVICMNCNGDGSGCFSIYLGGQWLNMYGYCAIPVPPAAGIPVQLNAQIIWNWNAVPIATGYKINTINDFATATDMGTATTKNETGLLQGSSYTRYVWAYNACGYSYPPTILIADALACGSTFTVNHVGGTVAPSSKTVTYGTVTNIPGEAPKCWITRNLGASQQPASVSDNTEASAGWYWQFNLKQGYWHNGTNRYPTTWVNTITENSDWIAANDPCTLLLGITWRIPTAAEWTNVDASGAWSGWNGPWNSDLQMHAAGNLASGGSLGNRGSYGFYWSNTQDVDNGLLLMFSVGSSFINTYQKMNGFPLRCLRVL